MGIIDSVKNIAAKHGTKHVVRPWKGYRQAKEQMKETSGADQQKWRDIKNQHRNKLIKTAGVAGTLGAGYLGAKAIKGTFNGTKNLTKSTIENSTAYDFLIIFTLLMYFILTPVYRINFYSTLIFQALLIIVIIFAVLSDSEKNLETYTVMAMIFIIEVFLPTIVYQSQFLMGNKFIINYLMQYFDLL